MLLQHDICLWRWCRKRQDYVCMTQLLWGILWPVWETVSSDAKDSVTLLAFNWSRSHFRALTKVFAAAWKTTTRGPRGARPGFLLQPFLHWGIFHEATVRLCLNNCTLMIWTLLYATGCSMKMRSWTLYSDCRNPVVMFWSGKHGLWFKRTGFHSLSLSSQKLHTASYQSHSAGTHGRESSCSFWPCSHH